MNNEPLVSVVVPVYNQEKYLDAAYTSLVEQSYTNLELIFVNDGSTDASTEMLRAYIQRDHRVRVIEKPNGGLVDATLAGIAAATGEYLCFLDPDDRLGKDYVRFFMDHMCDGCDFVAAGMYNVDNGVHTPFYLREDRLYTGQELRKYANVYLYEQDCKGISNRFFISRWNKLYRTQLVKTIAPIFSEFKHISLGEDSLFTYLVLQHSNGGRTVKQCNTYYYDVGNSNSMTKTDAIETYLKKAYASFQALSSLTSRFSSDGSQAYALYGLLIDVLANRIQNGSHQEFCFLHRQLSRDREYKKACALMGWTGKRLKRQMKAFLPVSVVRFIKKMKSR